MSGFCKSGHILYWYILCLMLSVPCYLRLCVHNRWVLNCHTVELPDNIAALEFKQLHNEKGKLGTVFNWVHWTIQHCLISTGYFHSCTFVCVYMCMHRRFALEGLPIHVALIGSFVLKMLVFHFPAYLQSWF